MSFELGGSDPEMDVTKPEVEEEPQAKCAPTNKTARCSRYAWYSFFAANSAFVIGGFNAFGSMFAVNAIFSLLSWNSILSVWSLNSILSVASRNCIMCYKCHNDRFCIGE